MVAPPAYSNGTPVLRVGNPQAPPRLLGPGGKPIQEDDGQILAPHVFNFAAIWNYFNQTYSYRYDEALKTSWENALAMRRDTFIWGCLDERYLAVTQLPGHVVCFNDKDERQKQRADELFNLVEAIPKRSGLFRNLEEAVWYGRYGVQFGLGPTIINGFSQTNIVYHVPINGDKIQMRWDGIPAIMISPTKRTEYADRGWTVGVGERSPLLYLDKPELRERFAINQHWRDDADYFEGEMAGAVGGVGIRSRIYWSWWMRYEMLGWAVNYMRKVGTLGLLVFPFLEGNPDSESAANTNIKHAGNRSALAVPVPMGTDPKQVAPFILSPSNAGIDALTGMIDSYWERHIERYIVGQNMSDGKDNESGLGGTGRSQFAADTKFQKIKADAELLAECITADILKPLHKWNYPGEPFTFKWTFAVADPKSKEKLDSAKTLVDMGVELRADDVREVGGFDKPSPDDETIGGQTAAPFGVGLDGQPMKSPMGFQTETVPEELPGQPQTEGSSDADL